MPGTRLPVETLYKLSISGLGFLATFFYEGVSFTDADGNYRKMATVISMSIYGIFFVHSLLELLLLVGAPLITDSHHVSAALGFLWYAMASYFRYTRTYGNDDDNHDNDNNNHSFPHHNHPRYHYVNNNTSYYYCCNTRIRNMLSRAIRYTVCSPEQIRSKKKVYIR